MAILLLLIAGLLALAGLTDLAAGLALLAIVGHFVFAEHRARLEEEDERIRRLNGTV
jgi:hypothetical protein